MFNIIQKYKNQIDFILMCDDTFHMLSKLAFYSRTTRLSDKTKVFAVTGSIGKTSTTEMLYSILNEKYSIFRGEPEINIKLRILHKFLEVDENIDVMLFECSGHVKGYLKSYSEILMPDGIIITRATNENLSTYGSIEALSREKISLATSMNKDGLFILDDSTFFKHLSNNYKPKPIFVNDNDYKLIKSDKNGSKFIYKNEEYEILVVGVHQISNAIKAIEFALQLNFDTKTIKKGLLKFRNVGNRWLVDKYKNGVEFITDCPNNASYETLIQNIKTFIELYKDVKNKRLIISKITDLSKEEEKEIYTNIAKYLSNQPLNEIILINKETKIISDYLTKNSNIKVTCFERSEKLDNTDPLCKYLIDTLTEPQAVLIKAHFNDSGINYGNVKDVIRKELKEFYIHS